MNAGASILVVEDMKTTAHAIEAALKSVGFVVTVAYGADEAKRLIAEPGNVFGCLITDLNLGCDATGWDVAREARGRNPEIPVIYLTGNADALPMTDLPKSLIIQKPVTSLNLVRAVTSFTDRLLRNHADALSDSVEGLQFRLGKAEDSNRRLTRAAKVQALRHSVSTRSDGVALAVSREETKNGQADLLASETALAHAQEETKHGLAELLASETALASSQAETKVGIVDLLASAAALATSRAETKISLTDLLASAAALAISRAETKTGQSNLLASETANKSLLAANDLLVTNEAALEQIVEQRTAELTREMEDHRIAEEALHQGEKLRALGQLTGGIAHDFNNILQLVFSTAALLRAPDLSEEERLELLDGLENAAALAGQVTSRLLAFARKKVMISNTCFINDVLQNMDELLLPTLGAKITLELGSGPNNRVSLRT